MQQAVLFELVHCLKTTISAKKNFLWIRLWTIAS